MNRFIIETLLAIVILIGIFFEDLSFFETYNLLLLLFILMKLKD